jgi:hypothetical protein
MMRRRALLANVAEFLFFARFHDSTRHFGPDGRDIIIN